MGEEVYWQEMFCPSCNKLTKHRFSRNREVKIRIDPNNPFNKNIFFDEHGKKTKLVDNSIFEDTDIKWVCWTCKSNKKQNIAYLNQDEKVYLTLFQKPNPLKTKEDKERLVFDKLAEVVSYLEDRLALIEKTILGKNSKRGIRIKK